MEEDLGFHPIFCFLDNTNEALAALLRPGNAGSNTATDHIGVLDQALAQIPDEHRHGTPILVRTDSAGASRAFLAHVRSLRTQGIEARFSTDHFGINQAWLELSLTAIDLIAWAQTLLLDGDFAATEPKKIRYRLLHTAARITTSARRTRLLIAEGWPWKDHLTEAFTRLAVLPRPAT